MHSIILILGNNRIIPFIFLMFFTSLMLFSQDPGSAEEFHLKKARESFEIQEFEDALNHFKKLADQHSEKPEYKYQTAMCHYKMKGFKKTIKIAEKLITDFPNESKYYRLIANSYDLSGEYDQGVYYLEAGIQLLPNSGGLYFDRGVIEMERGNVERALYHWERGIKASPLYSDNYYWAAKYYADSDEKIWAIMYAEMFLNIERGTDRFSEISKLLTDTYLNLLREIPKVNLGDKYNNEEEIARKVVEAYEYFAERLRAGDTLTRANVPEYIINAKPKQVDTDMVMANNSMIQLQSQNAKYQLDRNQRNTFEEAFLYVLTMLRENGILNLPTSGRMEDGSYNLVLATNFIRTNFVELWMQLNHQKMPVNLFVFQFDLYDRKLFDAYNHWLLSSGDPDYFIKWQGTHMDEYQIFLDALISKPLKVDVENYFSRLDYIIK